MFNFFSKATLRLTTIKMYYLPIKLCWQSGKVPLIWYRKENELPHTKTVSVSLNLRSHTDMNNILPRLTCLPNLTYLNTWLLPAKVIKQNINKFYRQMGPLFGLHIFPGSHGQNHSFCHSYRSQKHHPPTWSWPQTWQLCSHSHCSVWK
jgi:hypothetical protein